MCVRPTSHRSSEAGPRQDNPERLGLAKLPDHDARLLRGLSLFIFVSYFYFGRSLICLPNKNISMLTTGDRSVARGGSTQRGEGPTNLPPSEDAAAGMQAEHPRGSTPHGGPARRRLKAVCRRFAPSLSPGMCCLSAGAGELNEALAGWTPSASRRFPGCPPCSAQKVKLGNAGGTYFCPGLRRTAFGVHF